MLTGAIGTYVDKMSSTFFDKGLNFDTKTFVDDIKNTVDAIDPETGIKVFDRFGVKTSLRELELKELHKLSLKKMKGNKKKKGNSSGA